MNDELKRCQPSRRLWMDEADEYQVNAVLSPLSRWWLLLAALLVLSALSLMTGVRYGWLSAVGLPLHRVLSVAHLLRGTGECVLLGCLAWGLSVWQYCPHRKFAAFILLMAVYHLVAAAGYWTGTANRLATHFLFVSYLLAGAVLSLDILLTFCGRLLKVFWLLLLILVTAACSVYVPDVASVAYVINKVAALSFIVTLLAVLKR